jgi:hypothetical protein
MNTSFRSAFLSFDVACIKDDSLAYEVILSLQELFVRMHSGPWKNLSPGDLLRLFGLDVGYQQDILEFVKLIFEYLSFYLKQSANPKLQNLIESEFRGSFLHVTCCEDCGSCTQTRSYFYEISLPIVPPSLSTDQILTESFNVSGTGYKFAYDEFGNPFSIAKAISTGSVELNWCLNNYFSPEVLCDSNQFYCGVCQHKCDAIRTVHLETLPPVLNLQLMRFVYDAATQTKKKLHTMIEIPKVLEFQLMISSGTGFCTTVAYELSGIVSHFGESTHSGHYIAELRDECTGSWYRFNDNVVELMKHPPALTSKAAYMVLYSRKDKKTYKEPKLTGALQQSALHEIETFWNDANAYSKKKDKLEIFIKNRKEEVKEVFKTIQMDVAFDEKDTAMIISESWLRNWIMGLSVDTLPEDDYEYSEWHPGKIQNQEFLCEHNLLDPNKRHLFLRIHPIAWSFLAKRNGFDVEIKASNLCNVCAREKIKIDSKKKALDDERNLMIQTRKGEMAILKELSKLKVFPVANQSPPCGKFYIVPDSWRKRWFAYCRGETNERVGPVDTSSLICKHGKLHFSPYPAVSHFKDQGLPTNPHGIVGDVIPSEWDYLITNYGLIGPEVYVVINEPTGPARLITNSKSKGKIRPWSAVSVECSPDLCIECAHEFSKLMSEKHQSLGKITIEQHSDPPVCASSDVVSTASARSTRSAASLKTLSSFSLDFDGSSLVRNLKEQISNEISSEEGIASLFSLYYNGKLIDETFDDSKCIDLGLSKGAVLQYVKANSDKIQPAADYLETGAADEKNAATRFGNDIGEAPPNQSSTEKDEFADEKGFEGTHLYKIAEKVHEISSEGSKQSADPVLIWHFVDPRRGLLGIPEDFQSEYDFRAVAISLLDSHAKSRFDIMSQNRKFRDVSQNIFPVASRLHALLSRITEQNHAAVFGSSSSTSIANEEHVAKSSSKSNKKRRR